MNGGGTRVERDLYQEWGVGSETGEGWLAMLQLGKESLRRLLLVDIGWKVLILYIPGKGVRMYPGRPQEQPREKKFPRMPWGVVSLGGVHASGGKRRGDCYQKN